LSKYNFPENKLIKHNPDILFYSNIFLFFLYFLYTIKNVIFENKILNKNSFLLALLYLKYLYDCILNSKDDLIYNYEFRRIIMWSFTTPVMLKMYCDINELTLFDINFQYHIIPIIINVLIYPYKNTYLYNFFTVSSNIMFCFFMKKLYLNRNKIFGNLYLYIWCLFIIINIIEISKLTNTDIINIYYSYADFFSKIITNIVINDYYIEINKTFENIDLQSIDFIGLIIKNINNYCLDNSLITAKTENLINNTKNYFKKKIPSSLENLQIELLEKILPFGFDRKVIFNDSLNSSKHNMICVLFTDVVNYTELAKQYDDVIIFNLLKEIYNKFDSIKKKYSNLQKIETIGDAYMVVGDIYKKTCNHKEVIKQIIMFSFDLLNEIKFIKTPNNQNLSIRIGISIGDVSVGVTSIDIPRLCIVGNTVNFASRLQSTAEIDTIHVSRHINEQFKEIVFGFTLETKKNQNIFLKNIGNVETYTIYKKNV
jgi:class 3 adenylate cyclase